MVNPKKVFMGEIIFTQCSEIDFLFSEKERKLFKEVEGLIARQTRFKKQVLDVPSPVIRTKQIIDIKPSVQNSDSNQEVLIHSNPSAPEIQTEIRYAELSESNQFLDDGSISAVTHNKTQFSHRAEPLRRTESTSASAEKVPQTCVILVITFVSSILLH